MNIDLRLGDCLIKLKELEDNSVDAIVTDPPYELGFMGKSWDASGIAFNQAVWALCRRVLKPGGYLLSFGGTRTYHRMTVAIEDAGFEIRDMVEWVYGSGFPKSLNIGKAVDKLLGNEREITGKDRSGDKETHKTYNMAKLGGSAMGGEYNITKGTSEWEGWGTALKPAHEPICMARKPLSEKTVAENVLKYGTGGINIDGCRVEGLSEKELNWTPQRQHAEQKTYHKGVGGAGVGNEMEMFNKLGRFPANLIHDNSEEVRECFPNESERFFKSIIYQAKASKSGRGEGNNHPTVKPIALMEYLIKMVSKEGAVILDPFMGSGSTGIACKNLNRNFIGIELEPDYIKIAQARINGTLNSYQLFNI